MNFGAFGPSAEQRQMEAMIEQKQMKDFLKMYANLVDRCFTDCVSDFTSTKLSTKEETCVQRCTDKFLKHSERVGQRFAEQNAALQQSQQQ
ncbi:Tim10/DDP family zinc finger protein [Hyaloraphidium curvatum]|nr:Tim10/DDP family zinc finger protein [Hyaloraphidium curvatum]